MVRLRGGGWFEGSGTGGGDEGERRHPERAGASEGSRPDRVRRARTRMRTRTDSDGLGRLSWEACRVTLTERGTARRAEPSEESSLSLSLSFSLSLSLSLSFSPLHSNGGKFFLGLCIGPLGCV